MKLQILIPGIFFLAITSLSAQWGSGVSGIVIDADDQTPLIGATVLASTHLASTNYDGRFTLDAPPGAYPVQISYVGYQTITLDVIVEEGSFATVEIRLQPSSMMLEAATVTSGRFERALGETTVSLDILKPQFIDHLNMVSLDEALDRLPGVNIIDGQPNIRGGSGYSYGAGSRVMLLIDDIPALQADAGYPNWGDIQTENIDQVEVLKGAASALYGSAALNGIINVRTAYAKSTPYTRISTFYQAFMDPSQASRKWWDNAWSHKPGSGGISITHRQKFNKLDVSGSAFYINTESWVKDAFSKTGRGTIGLRYRISDRFVVGMNANLNAGASRSYFLWENDQEGAYLAGAGSNESTSKKIRYYVDPYLNYFDRAGNRHKVLTRFYSVNNDNNLNQGNRSQLYYGEYQFQRNLSGLDLLFTAGVVASGSRVDAELYADTIFQSRNLAGYVQVEKKWWKWLTVTAGARLENNAILGPEIIGKDTLTDGRTEETKPVFRLGANAKISPFTFIRASWGQGYRFPTIAEKFIRTEFSGFQIVPNPHLRSETGWSAELGLKQGVQIGTWNGFLDVALFWTEYQRMMEFSLTPNFAFQSQNIGNTIIKGFEVSWQGQGTLFGQPVSMLTGYTYIDPTYETFGSSQMNGSSSDKNVLKYRFRHSVKADFEMPVTSWLSAGYTMQYNSYMEAIDGIFNLIPGVYDFRQANHKGFVLMDVRLGFQITPRLESWFIVKNMLNEAYSIRPALLEEPRSLTLRVNYFLQGK
ncbi:MAG: TonB-dependent receptor [Saprospiraceae bacterium]|nr:TonB-dependent receptor [Saprospiraceae bacterium]